MSSSNLPQKRSLSPDATIPPEDCTRDTFDQHANLSDRQFLSWALQTEARIRFKKLEGRDDDDSTSDQDTTLNSEYLIDLYPSLSSEEVTEGKLAPERHAYARKSIPYLESARGPDASFETLVRLEFKSRSQSKDLQKTLKESLPIPPNLLYFEIILEAYMGYAVPSFRSKDAAEPSAAVMGGAVVAALTGWRDAHVVKAFQKHEKPLRKALKNDNVRSFKSAKEAIRKDLHIYFLYQESTPERQTLYSYIPAKVYTNSPFSLGDVDIFLQASPLTRSLMNSLSGLPQEVRETIGSNLGGSGFVHGDLQRFATMLCDEHLQIEFKDLGRYVYALAKNGLSFALGVHNEESFMSSDGTWPRSTQLLMLNEKADLVGGLMDFDISVASCAYDGVTVYATPRAAFSLKTLTQIVTPFVYEERRNRRRITKYYERGFDAYVLDPFCSHEQSCFNHEEIDDGFDGKNLTEVAPYESHKLRTRERYQEIIRLIEVDEERHGLNCPHIYICDLAGKCRRGCSGSARFSAALIEATEGHAVEYFSQRDSWSEEERQEILSYPEHRRFVCRGCRETYAMALILDNGSPVIQNAETVEDLLHGEVSYMQGRGWKGDFMPSFYGCGAFNSERVGNNARTDYQLYRALRAQDIMESNRYFHKHGTVEGYRKRFVYGYFLEEVFSLAAEHDFPSNGRAAVGLNPERFVARCKGCSQWLHECEWNVQYCDHCGESKPAAIES